MLGVLFVVKNSIESVAPSSSIGNRQKEEGGTLNSFTFANIGLTRCSCWNETIWSYNSLCSKWSCIIFVPSTGAKIWTYRLFVNKWISLIMNAFSSNLWICSKLYQDWLAVVYERFNACNESPVLDILNGVFLILYSFSFTSFNFCFFSLLLLLNQYYRLLSFFLIDRFQYVFHLL